MRLRRVGIVLTIFLLIIVLFFGNKVEAVEIKEEMPEELSEQLQNISNENILDIYDKITEKYSNDEIADMIQENKNQIAQEAGISESVIDAGAEFIRNTSQEDIRNILENDDNINEIRKSLQQESLQKRQ